VNFKNSCIFGHNLSRNIVSMQNLETIGVKIRNLREGADMPLRKLAALLDVDQSTLSKIERNERKPNIKMIEEISKIFNVDKDELLISFYSDIVFYEIQDENSFSEILQVAEAKIQYQRTITNKEK
jgi:transcriptional regulator with XRE-family HTH domain